MMILPCQTAYFVFVLYYPPLQRQMFGGSFTYVLTEAEVSGFDAS